MDKTIVVRITKNYGNEAIYPICENAKLFAALAKTTTLTRNTLAIAKKLGYAISVEPVSL